MTEQWLLSPGTLFKNSFQWPTSHRRRQKAASIDFSPKSIFNLETAAAAEIKDYYSCTLSHECVAKHILVRTTDIQGKRHWKMLSGSYHEKALKLLLTLALGIFYFWTVCVYFFWAVNSLYLWYMTLSNFSLLYFWTFSPIKQPKLAAYAFSKLCRLIWFIRTFHSIGLSMIIKVDIYHWYLQ